MGHYWRVRKNERTNSLGLRAPPTYSMFDNKIKTPHRGGADGKTGDKKHKTNKHVFTTHRNDGTVNLSHTALVPAYTHTHTLSSLRRNGRTKLSSTGLSFLVEYSSLTTNLTICTPFSSHWSVVVLLEKSINIFDYVVSCIIQT